MPFIGNQPAESYSAFQKQDFTTSATTSYTLDHPVANQNEIALFINFVRQEPTTAYTASGTSLTLTSATASSDDMYCVYLGKAVQTVNPPSGSVGTSQLADSVKMTPSFFAYLNTTQSISDSTDTTLQMAAELWDTDSAFDTSTYKFTVPSGQAGKYWFYVAVQLQNLTDLDEARAMIYKNTSTRLSASRYFQGQNGTINYQAGVAVNLSAGDTIEFKTRQVSGGAKNAEGTSDVTYCLGYKLGGV